MAITPEGFPRGLSEPCRRYDTLLVVDEVATGLAVPFNGELDMAGLARVLELPLLIVAPTRLGTINHTVLTVRYARESGLNILGVVMNLRSVDPDIAERTNPGAVARLTGLPVHGPLNRLAPVHNMERPCGRSVIEAVGTAYSGLIQTLVEDIPFSNPIL